MLLFGPKYFGIWLCDSDLDNPTGIDWVLTEKYLFADSYSDLEASILDEKEFLLLKVISILPELSCLICFMVGAGLGTDNVALSMIHFSGRVTSSHFMVLGRETLAFVISVTNKVVCPLCGFKRTLDAQVFMTLYWILYINAARTDLSCQVHESGCLRTESQECFYPSDSPFCLGNS